MSYFESHKLKQIVALSGIVVLGLFLVFSLSAFIPALLGAIIFYIICIPFMNYLHHKKKMKKGLAVAIVILSSFLIILVPIFSITNLLFTKVNEMLSNNTAVFFRMHDANNYIKNLLGFNLFSPENILKVQEKITAIIPDVLNQTLNVVGDIAIMYFILFYLLYTDYNIKSKLIALFPYTKENAELFVKELTAQTYSNVLGAPLLAIVQGLFSILGFYIFGLNEPVFWGIMCGFLSFIPFIGTALVWIPAGFVQLSFGESWQGIGLLIYGAVVITNVDNVFRFVLQKKIANVHPLTTVFGVIIGLHWFGLPGLVFGPILISYFLIMIQIYGREYGNENVFRKDTLSEPEIENKNT